MTCREKLMKEHPSCVSIQYFGGCEGCPNTYGYLPRPDYCEFGKRDTCEKCWNREIPGTEPPKPLLHIINVDTIINYRKKLIAGGFSGKEAFQIINKMLSNHDFIIGGTEK